MQVLKERPEKPLPIPVAPPNAAPVASKSADEGASAVVQIVAGDIVDVNDEADGNDDGYEYELELEDSMDGQSLSESGSAAQSGSHDHLQSSSSSNSVSSMIDIAKYLHDDLEIDVDLLPNQDMLDFLAMDIMDEAIYEREFEE